MDQSMSRYTHLIREEPEPADSLAACDLLHGIQKLLPVPEAEKSGVEVAPDRGSGKLTGA